MKQLFSAIILFASFITLHGQKWVEEFEKPVNKDFKTIQKEFYDYWENREITKGAGYKQFKRWEWYWEDRLMPDGSFPPAGQALNEYKRFLKENPSNTRNTNSIWQSEGPNSSSGGYAGIGRINSLAFHPTDENIIYAGAAGGGLWQSIDGGQNWFTNTDNIGSLGVSGIVVDASNPDIVYIATGDGDASDNYSVGILKSIDGGATFSTTGLTWNTSGQDVIRRLIADPEDPNTLLAASNLGIYRTTDAGATWVKEISGNFYDVEPHYGSNSTIYYAVKKNAIYKSTDTGNTWTEIQAVSNSNRLALATSPANPSYVYVLSSGTNGGSNGGSGFNDLLRSTDDGNTFVSMSTSPNILGYAVDGNSSGGQGWYDLAFAMDQTDANTIYVGGVNNWKSTDGGATWSITSHWYGANGVSEVHADKHVLEFRGDVLWEGNDGGVYKSTNGGDTWTDLANGMVISQMYKLGVSQTDAKVITGLQDNGTKLRGISGNWTDEIGGDGMECAIDPSESNVMYGELYYGDIRRSTNNGSSWTNIQSNIPGDPSGAWITPFVLDENHPDTIAIGFKDVYRSFNRGSSWTKISTNLSGSNLRYLRIAESDSDYIYAGLGDEMWRTTDGGSNWETKTTPRDGTRTIIVHPNNPDSLWAVCSNYVSNGEKVYVSADGGSNWTDITGNLPNIPANTIVYLKGSDNGVYVGMDVGIYYKDDTMTEWELFNTALPNVEITELEINYGLNTLYAATYGRGLWKADLAACQAPLSLDLDSLVNDMAYFSWNASATTADLYDYQLTTSQTAPTEFDTTSNLNIAVPGLVYGNDYYFHVRSDCGGSLKSVWTVYGPINVAPSCEDTYYDTGGSANNYSDNENYSVTVCPNQVEKAISFVFNAFNVEDNWDALYIFNGPSTAAPKFDSGNGPTQAGYPAGGYYGTSIPGPFTSSHESGCLTLEFRSDQYVTRLGWDIDVQCVDKCSNKISETVDGFYGSIRHLINCSEDGTLLQFDGALLGDTLQLEGESIIIDKEIILLVDGGTVYVSSTINGPIFNITESGEFSINNMHLLPKDNTEALYIEGVLTPSNVTIKNQNNTITNKGNIMILNGSNFSLEE